MCKSLKPDKARIDALIYSYLINTLVVLTVFLIANYYSNPVVISIAILVSNVLAPFSLWMFISFRFTGEALLVFVAALILWYIVVCLVLSARGKLGKKRRAPRRKRGRKK